MKYGKGLLFKFLSQYAVLYVHAANQCLEVAGKIGALKNMLDNYDGDCGVRREGGTSEKWED